MVDALPVFSQVKSFFQWASGNSEGARKTQINFAKRCPLVSQCTSLVQATILGDEKAARETQIEFLKGVNGMVDSVPVVGHTKAAVHYICGDKEGCDNALKAASHTTGVMAGGVGGFLVGGPVGAVAGGVIGGACMDIVISAGDFIVNDNAQGYGLVDNFFRIVDDPEDPGTYVDLIGGVVLDGIGGYTAGNGLGKQIKYRVKKGNLVKAVGKEAAENIIRIGESMRKFRSENNIKSNHSHVMTLAKDRVTGKTALGHNKRMRVVPIPDGPTELQKRVPSAKQVLNRSISTCAEQEAYNILYGARPEASPGDLTSVSVRMDHKSQRIVTVPGCDNCKEFSSVMGTIATNSIPEIPVPVKEGLGVTAALIGTGVCVVGLNKRLKKREES